MRRSKIKLMALTVSLAMLTGCGQHAETVNITETAEESKEQESRQDEVEVSMEETEVVANVAASTSNAEASYDVESLKMKYASKESVEYAEPLYNLEPDHKFVFENLSEKFFAQSNHDSFRVFYDTSFDVSQEVRLEYDEDWDAGVMTISPAWAFSYEEDYDSETDDTWGSRSKFYLVQYKDLETGEDLEKPLVTVFTIANDLTAPNVSQGISEDGYYELSWNPVEGADYYEVYVCNDQVSFAELEVTTKETSCNYSQFKSEIERAKEWDETFGKTEVADADGWGMHERLEMYERYFVVAKTDDGKHSGMSNFCDVSDIGNQIPYMNSDTFQKEYEGNSALALPAYVDIEMLDGSVGKFVIEYHGAEVWLLEDGRIMVKASIKNLPLYMHYMYLTGVDYDVFMEEAQDLTGRSDELATKSITSTTDIDIPFLPDNPRDESDDEEETEVEIKTEKEEETEAEGKTEKEEEADSSNNVSVSKQLEDTVFATSALSEWIAINLVNHNETIPLDDFNEASDSEYLMDAVLEAYRQNPLVGMLDGMKYDYKNNCLIIKYGMSAEDTTYMQTESLKKAEEIVSEIITDDMTDYEKEEAINRYLCENACYNDEIMEYIDEDGTISEDAADKYVNSFTPYGILCEGVGVCESYSEAFLLLARNAGLEAVIMTGRMQNVNHEWNRVKIEDSWYSLDVTNNDREILPNCYFNLPDDLAASSLMQSKDAMLDESLADYTAEDMENEYYVKEGRYTEDVAEAGELLARELEKEKISTIRIDADARQSELEKIVRSALKELEIEGAKYYFCSGVLSIVLE